MTEKKTKYEKLNEKLCLKKKTFWETVTEKEKEQAFTLAEEYKKFLNNSNTEREVVIEIEKYAKKHKIKYFINKEKSIALVKIGKNSLSKGIKILGSHIDSPRLDLKINPLYEDTELALMKTHYYGGIKKYQWVNHPLALHGVIILKGGKKVDIIIGEKENEPIFTVPDLLPHLASKKQGKRKLFKGIEGEEMNILCGSIPVNDKKVAEKVKLAIMEKLNKDYGIVEQDFATAEIQVVPAHKAKDLGFDKSMVGGYGQDDRACAFPQLKATIDAKGNDTLISIFYDKEEIGSDGATGAQSRFLEYLIEQIIKEKKEKISVLEIMKNSKVISADVTAAVNPTYKDVMDLRNAARLGKGISLEKNTGSGGKYSASEATAEYMRWLIDLFDKNKVMWQTGGLGKVDEGGGGTIAKYVAKYGCDVIDAGVPLISMHSPLEITSKADIYSAYKAFKAFIKA